MKQVLVTSVITALIIPLVSYAHGGRTNSEGCHNDSKNNSYHCHNTKPSTVRSARTKARTEARQLSTDKDCPDFETQLEAQSFFLEQGGPEIDRHGLDRDKDGIACENNP